MNDATKGTNMAETVWAVEDDWSKALCGSEVQLRNRDGTLTLSVYNCSDPRVRNWDRCIESSSGVTYKQPDWILFMKVPPRVVLPQVAGVYQDANERHFSISMKDGEGSFGDQVWVNHASELQPPFMLLAPVSVTATRVVLFLRSRADLPWSEEIYRSLRFLYGVDL